MSGLPLVTIVIPFYNCPYIDQAIASALEQQYPNLEIIVVDDGSTRYQDRIAPYLDRISYLGKANGGTATALNHGFRMASGRYIAWLSSDDWLYPDKIAQQVHFMQQHQLQISYTDFHGMNEHGAITHLNQTIKFSNECAFIEAFKSFNPINGCTVMMTKDLFFAIGGFDEKLLYTHDYDAWIRILLAGQRIGYLNLPLTKYRWHANMGSRKHRPVISAEIKAIRARTRGPLTQLLKRYRQIGRC
ncbi:glycosyltransferase [Paenibacillus thermoaerophilus]|uniref:Glycosyltransferase n=1 Tax=Paenibacillus thermoaerophilus TaxID=1215385 RepID=A0ABW2V3A4_9BACL|nr:glycosyltransferase [Paenibacillus thermoaerophilus]TMV17712.1 glycosyltransferase [Paenibacillus thermoaerophilus]